VCGYYYKGYSGDYDGYKKISPDQYECSKCGFFYEEHIKYSLEKQAFNYKKYLKERRLK